MQYDCPSDPLIAIVGATGTGKSLLAVELALRFNGEIINGDAMQIYDGLPIITNKMSTEERRGVPHHLLGVVGLEEEPWRVGTFTKKALGVIKEIRSRGRIPILVGGTHYYTQSLLFNDALAQEDGENGTHNVSQEDVIKRWPLLEGSTEEMLVKLREVDPVMADRWHPNDRRKILGSLMIWLRTGRKASEIYEEQSARRMGTLEVTEYTNNNTPDTAQVGSRLKFPTLVLWVHASPDNLKTRLDERVEKMMLDGLLSEVEVLDTILKKTLKNGRAIDRTRGIWVSIGFKEFESYMTALKSDTLDEKHLASLKMDGIEQTQAATRQYAKRQVRWIRTKLIHALLSAGAQDAMFLLDGSELTEWHDAIEQPAMQIANAFLEGWELPNPSTLSTAAAQMLVPKRDYDFSDRRDLWMRKTCEVCGVTSVVEQDWMRHIKSRGHRTAVKKTAKSDQDYVTRTNSSDSKTNNPSGS
ncbi:MAG: hypothetical protein M1827_005707 [Pycnora praestabilis]|nr:MAG: hypothetical protein M1827_005707 [Pycnora praestabilis]